MDLLVYNLDCLTNSFYVLAPFLLTYQGTQLHITEPEPDHTPTDLRLHDYSFRYLTHLTCMTQTIRTVFAAQHAAHQYAVWASANNTSDMQQYIRQCMRGQVTQQLPQEMLRDGARLHELELRSGSLWVALIVGLDWKRFQNTPDWQLHSLIDEFVSKPPVQALLSSLSDHWMHQAFTQYHNQVLDYSLGDSYHNDRLLEHSPKRCNSCTLFLHPTEGNPTQCVGCRRGGFRCRGLEPLATDVQHRQFSIRVRNELSRLVTKCARLNCSLTGKASKLAAPDQAQLQPIPDNAAAYMQLEAGIIAVIAEIGDMIDRLASPNPPAVETCWSLKEKSSPKRPARRRNRTIARQTSQRPLSTISE